MARRTGKRNALSYKTITVVLFGLLFCVWSPEGPSCLSALQAPLPFLSISKNWCSQYSFFPSAILPCICTVFKESFVYVFAIKKENASKKKKRKPVNHLSRSTQETLTYATSLCCTTWRWTALESTLKCFSTSVEVSERVKRRVPKSGTSVCFPRSPVFFPPAFIFFLPLHPSAGSSRGLWGPGGPGWGELNIASAVKLLQIIRIYFNCGKSEHMGGGVKIDTDESK